MNKLIAWVDNRIPLVSFWKNHLSEYYAPKNFNIWYIFGSLALVVLVNQILTGIWLTMHFVPTEQDAFASVEHMMRDVEFGWLIRYLHAVGASAFFIVVYLHMFRGFIYGSYKAPRELIWLLGMCIYLALMGEAFFGYLLPWGQMSFWGAQVITSLFGAIPYIGDDLALWIRGDYNVSGATLNRFFSLHVIAMPLLIVGLVFLHLTALHHVGSNNPDGVEIKNKKDDKGIPLDGIPFHPFYTVKDIFGLAVFLAVFFVVVFFFPEGGGYFMEHANFEPANPMVTPEHIAPVWYFTPFYAMLRAVPDKFLGVIVMGAAVAIMFVLPWLDRGKVKSIRYRSTFYKLMMLLFVISFIGLGILGIMPADPLLTIIARVLTGVYFFFFLAMPLYTYNEKTKPVPDRVTMP